MEASQAGLAADGEAQQGEQAQEQAQQPDWGQLQQSQEQMASSLEEMRGWMAESQAQQPAEQEQSDEPADLSFLDPESPNYDQEHAGEMLLQHLQEQNQTALQQAVEPLNEEVRQLRSEREAEILAAQFPELENPETIKDVMTRTNEWVQAAGLPPEAASNMQVIKAVYMMGRAAELHESEQQEQQQAATLEGAAGATPGGASQGGLTADSIVNAGGPRKVLPY